MPLIRKSLICSFKIALINIVLLTANNIGVGAEQTKHSSALNLRQLEKSEFSKTQWQFIASEKYKINNAVAVESSEDGIPSLRRQPSGGQRFEPKRIPLQISVPQNTYRASPSITIINPSAYGASWGNAGIGLAYQE